MALWMRGGKDWSWTLHLQSAQWVVLVTTSFSPSLSISLMLLAWSPHFFNDSFLSIFLIPAIAGSFRPFSKASRSCPVFGPVRFFVCSHIPLPSSLIWAKIYILENFWTVLDSAPKLFSLGKSSGLFEVGGYVREELRSEGNWTPASLILNLRTRRGLSLTKTVSTWLVLYFRWTWTSVVSLGHYIFQREFAVITCSST